MKRSKKFPLYLAHFQSGQPAQTTSEYQQPCPPAALSGLRSHQALVPQTLCAHSTPTQRDSKGHSHGLPILIMLGINFNHSTKCKLHANPLQKAFMRSTALGGKIWSAPVRNHGLKMNFIGPFFCSKFLHRNIILCIFGPDCGPELFVMHFPVPESW